MKPFVIAWVTVIAPWQLGIASALILSRWPQALGLSVAIGVAGLTGSIWLVRNPLKYAHACKQLFQLYVIPLLLGFLLYAFVHERLHADFRSLAEVGKTADVTVNDQGESKVQMPQSNAVAQKLGQLLWRGLSEFMRYAIQLFVGTPSWIWVVAGFVWLCVFQFSNESLDDKKEPTDGSP